MLIMSPHHKLDIDEKEIREFKEEVAKAKDFMAYDLIIHIPYAPSDKFEDWLTQVDLYREYCGGKSDALIDFLFDTGDLGGKCVDCTELLSYTDKNSKFYPLIEDCVKNNGILVWGNEI